MYLNSMKLEKLYIHFEEDTHVKPNRQDDDQYCSNV